MLKGLRRFDSWCNRSLASIVFHSQGNIAQRVFKNHHFRQFSMMKDQQKEVEQAQEQEMEQDQPVESSEATENKKKGEKRRKKKDQALDDVPDWTKIEKGVVPEGYDVITEGSASLLFKKDTKTVFYNEAQVKNRDLSILVLNEYAKQLEMEAYEQRKEREDKKGPWRRTKRTWDTWGEVDNSTSFGEQFKKGDLTGMTILEALSASGLRSIRYLNEIVAGVGVDHILVNDLEEHAVGMIKANAAYNGVSEDPRFVPNQGDAVMVMYKHRTDPKTWDATHIKSYLGGNRYKWDTEVGTYDVVDLDPYGSPSIFLDSAVQAVRDGGLLCVTATDLAAICGKSKEAAYARYSAVPNKYSAATHEFAARLILGSIATRAAVYGRHIVPLLTVKMDFYVRCFVRIYEDKNECNRLPTRMGMVLQSKQCDSFFVQRLSEAKVEGRSDNFLGKSAAFTAPAKCNQTDSELTITGPIWVDRIHNFAFVESLTKRLDRKGPGTEKLGNPALIHGLLFNVCEEVKDAPLYYNPSKMCKALHVSTPRLVEIYSALDRLGYQFSKTHMCTNGLKTDAPETVLWDIMRHQAKIQKVASKKQKEDPISQKILSKPIVNQVDFRLTDKARKYVRKDGKGPAGNNRVAVARFPLNPKKNWGPKSRARGVDARQTHRGSGKYKNLTFKRKRDDDDEKAKEETRESSNKKQDVKDEQQVKEDQPATTST